MSAHFEKINVKKVVKETPDCVSVLFDIPEALHKKFYYKHGQHLTMRTFINGEEIRRSYSLCSSPLEEEWRVAIKKTDGGFFSTYANEQLKSGDTLELMPPIGNFFTELSADHEKSYIAFAAGSGITPVLSLIKTVLATEPKSNFMLVYGNRNRRSIIFLEELEGLKNKYMSRLSLMHILSRETTDATINAGRIDYEKCRQLFEKVLNIRADEFFICGPEAMTLSVKRFLQDQNVNAKKIHLELFNAEGGRRTNIKKEKFIAADIPKSRVKARLDGISFEFDANYEDEAILDAALATGADLPYSCKGGVCCTCKAKLLVGKVQMDVSYGLEPEEIEQGFILTCQAHPLTDKVSIDFDIK